MNNLSWFIYLVQVADDARGVLQFACGVLLFVALMALIFAPILLSVLDDLNAIPTAKRVAKGCVVALVVMGTVFIITPSRQTLLLIAGSEIGERVVKSDQVTSVVNPGLDLLKSWIAKETARLNASDKGGSK